MYIFRGILTILFISISYQGFSQSKAYVKTVKAFTYSDNVSQPLTVKEKTQLKAVYGNQLQNLILDRPQRLKDVKDILRNRVEIGLASDNPKSQFAPLLSTVPLFNNYNTKLKRDDFFDKNNFNPLKYNFDFHGFSFSMYRIDNTDYVVMIIPQRR
jgi:hypothetical protein